MAEVTGRVVSNFSQRPVQDAQVSIGASTARTDTNGRFAIDAADRRVTVRITHPDFKTLVEQVNASTRTDTTYVLQPRFEAL